jgi:hypothetical protein
MRFKIKYTNIQTYKHTNKNMNCGYANLSEAFDMNESSEDNSLTFDITTSNGKTFGLVTINCSSTRKKLTKFTWEAFPSSSSKKHLKKLKGTISDTDVNSFLFPINNTIDTSDYFVYVTPFFSDFKSTEQFPERKHHPYHPTFLPNEKIDSSSETQGEVIYSIFYTQQLFNKTERETDLSKSNCPMEMRSCGKNANYQLRAEPVNPSHTVSPWLMSTISPDFAPKTQCPVAYDRYMDSKYCPPFSPVDPGIMDTGIGISKEALHEIVQTMIPDQKHVFAEDQNEVQPKCQDWCKKVDSKDFNQFVDLIFENVVTSQDEKNVKSSPDDSVSSKPSQSRTASTKESNSLLNLVRDICSNLTRTDNKIVHDILEHITENKEFQNLLDEVCSPNTPSENDGLTEDEQQVEYISVNLDSESSSSENNSPKKI